MISQLATMEPYLICQVDVGALAAAGSAHQIGKNQGTDIHNFNLEMAEFCDFTFSTRRLLLILAHSLIAVTFRCSFRGSNIWPFSILPSDG